MRRRAEGEDVKASFVKTSNRYLLQSNQGGGGVLSDVAQAEFGVGAELCGVEDKNGGGGGGNEGFGCRAQLGVARHVDDADGGAGILKGGGRKG
jgi:hypothetical protein